MNSHTLGSIFKNLGFIFKNIFKKTILKFKNINNKWLLLIISFYVKKCSFYKAFSNVYTFELFGYGY